MFQIPLAYSTAMTRIAREKYAEFAPFQPDIPGSWLADRYTNDASAFVDVGGSRIHYRDQGPEDAPTLIALHGVYSSLHTWEKWKAAFGDRVRFVSLTLPGFGLTGPNESGRYELSYYVEVLEQFCEQLDLGTVAVAGNSLGGAIAWRFAATHLDRVGRLLLIDAGRQNVVPEAARLLSQPGFDFVPRYLTPRQSVRAVLRDAYGDPSKLDAADVRRYHDLLLRTGNRRAVLKLAKVAAPAPMEPTAVECPTLVQWGEADDWLPPVLGERFVREIPDARLQTYPGVGHVPMEESPTETAADAASFLDVA